MKEISSSMNVILEDGPHRIEFYFTGDHMCHYKLGECNAPSATSQGNFLCPYCESSVNDVQHTSLDKRRKVSPEAKTGALLKNIDMYHRVPDMLHCIKRVT